MVRATLEFRRSGVRWLQVALCGVPGVIFCGGIIVNSTHDWEKIAYGAGLLFVVVLAIRIARLGIFAAPDVLVVRNYFSTYRIRWHRVAAFEMPPPYGTLRKTGLRIRLQDGRLISASLYRQGQHDSEPAARAVLEKLQLLRDEHVRAAGAQQSSQAASEHGQPAE